MRQFRCFLCLFLAVCLMLGNVVFHVRAASAEGAPAGSEAPAETQGTEDASQEPSDESPEGPSQEPSEEPPEEPPEEPSEAPPEEPTEAPPEQTEPVEPPFDDENQEEFPSDPEVVYTWDLIPRYYQNDYPLTMYGAGTVADSGCSITCLAMVATYLTGEEYYPDQLARYFGGKAQNYMDRLEYGSTTMELPYYKSPDFHKTMEALREGKIAIALMNKKSLFTDTQHFILLTGLTSDGKVMVHDPWKPNITQWNLADSFENGFDPDDILYGYSGAWIYDKDAMPENPYLYYEEERDFSDSRYPHFQLTGEDLDLIARLIWCEARGECYEGQQAVAEIILNRMADPNFPNTVRGNIYAEGQFRTVDKLDDADPNQTQYDAILDALYGPNVLPMDVFYFAREPLNDNVWGRIGGHVFCYAW